MTLTSNGGSMSVDKIVDIGENQAPVWFFDKAIVNILSLKDAIARYQDTYNREDMEFIIHHNVHGKLNILFKIHSSSFHCYDPSQEEFTFVNTVIENKRTFTKDRWQVQIKQENYTLVSRTH